MDSEAEGGTDVSLGNKRPHSAVSVYDDSESDTETEIKVSAKINKARRGKNAGRGRSDGLSRAREELKRLESEAKEVAFDKVLRSRAFRKETRPVLDLEESSCSETRKEDPSRLCSEELRATAGQCTAAILEVAQKPGSLKGPQLKKLKESATTLQSIVDALVSRTEEEETRHLRADNGRLRKEVESLRAELKAHRREFSNMKASIATTNEPTSSSALDARMIEELKGSIVSSVGVMLDARFAGIEERLLPEKIHRPPLAADKRQVATMTPSAAANSSPLTSASRVPPINNKTMTKPSWNVAVSAPDAAESSSEMRACQNSEWSTVVRRGKRIHTSDPSAKVASSETPIPSTKPKLNAPRTAAIIVSLQPEAVERGVTYAQVLEQAELGVNLQELGIGSGMKVRRAATGARLLELPKEQTAEQADIFAEKLRTVLDGVANVVRPVKCADIVVTGLDDSVTKEKVLAAVVRTGNCSSEAVKVGEVRTGPGGMGMVNVRCPVGAAKILSDAGRILVGWSSARIQVLEQRPMRCYKCLGIGHTRTLCPSSSDRGNLCFRCGREGHKASDCTGALHCAVCAEVGLPSGHMMGGRVCNPPHVKGKMTHQSPFNSGEGQRLTRMETNHE